MSGVLELARELVSLQEVLVAATRADFKLDHTQSILDLPVRFGAIGVDRTLWGFTMHGAGIRFVDVRSLALVDMEIRPDETDLFTAWRLRLFAESAGSDVELSEACVNGIESAGGEMLRLSLQ